MSQRKDNDNVEHKGTILAVQDSTLSSKYTAKEKGSKPVEKAKIIKKKSFFQRLKTNRFWLIRGLYYVLHSVWIVVMAIGGFIAWLIAILLI